MARTLVGALAERRPACQLLLLTRSSSHDELADLDAPNVRREVTLHDAPPGECGGWRRRAFAAVDGLPPPAARYISDRLVRIRYAVRNHGPMAHSLRDKGVDLLYCPFTRPQYAEPSVPVVCTVHDLQHVALPEFFGALERAEREHSFRMACHRATFVTAISDFTRASVITHGGLQPSATRTIYLRMAGRLALPAGPHDQVLRRLELRPGRFLLYPANFWRHKNHEILLDAFARCAKNGLPSDIALVCTGARDARQSAIAGLATDLGIAGRLRFPGHVSDLELAALVSECSGIVFPSLFEGFGLPVLEAMSAGVPVACSNCAALPEITAGAALLFDPRSSAEIADAMVRLVLDSSLRTRLVNSGPLRAAQFNDTARMGDEFWQLFDDATAQATMGHTGERRMTGARVT